MIELLKPKWKVLTASVGLVGLGVVAAPTALADDGSDDERRFGLLAGATNDTELVVPHRVSDGDRIFPSLSDGDELIPKPRAEDRSLLSWYVGQVGDKRPVSNTHDDERSDNSSDGRAGGWMPSTSESDDGSEGRLFYQFPINQSDNDDGDDERRIRLFR